MIQALGGAQAERALAGDRPRPRLIRGAEADRRKRAQARPPKKPPRRSAVEAKPPAGRRRSQEPVRNAARLGRQQRHHGPALRRRQALRPHPRRRPRLDRDPPLRHRPRPARRPRSGAESDQPANTIVGRPYVWGGGHASFYSYGYDCSGSVSFALFGGGLIPEPLTSGSLEGWGEPGPGKWITVYANAEHTFMEIDGLRWDTVGDARGTGPRWHLEPTEHRRLRRPPPPGPLGDLATRARRLRSIAPPAPRHSTGARLTRPVGSGCGWRAASGAPRPARTRRTRRRRTAARRSRAGRARCRA